jgi:intracellular multiplication protein IcmK
MNRTFPAYALSVAMLIAAGDASAQFQNSPVTGAPAGTPGQPGNTNQDQNPQAPGNFQGAGNFQIQNQGQSMPNNSGTGGLDANGVPSGSIPPVDATLMNGLGQDADGDAAHRALFKAALNSVFPFSPDEIQQLFDKMHENQSAMAVPSMGNPKAEVKAETIPLEPGAEPPVIELDTGYVTTVSFLDSSGNPWPIQDIGVGGNFDVPAPDEGGNVLRMTALAKYSLGNMSVRLVGLTSPLSFRLRATTGRVFYRYDARIPRSGPRAAPPLIEHGNDLAAGDSLLMAFLDGAAPLNSTRLTVTGVDDRTAAWRLDDIVYVRTPYTLLSPGWNGSVGSGDGTRVYSIADTPVLLLSDNGNLIHARIGNNARTDQEPVPAIEDGLAHPMHVSDDNTNSSGGQLTTRPGYAMTSSYPSRTLIRPVQTAGQGAQATSNNNGTSGQPSNNGVAGVNNGTGTQGNQP